MDGSLFRNRSPATAESPLYQFINDDWQDRLDEQRTSNRRMFKGMCGAMALAGAAVCLSGFLYSLPQEKREIVEIDATTRRPVVAAKTASEKSSYVAAVSLDRLENFIRDVRSVRPDRTGQKEQMRGAYMMTVDGSPARKSLLEARDKLLVKGETTPLNPVHIDKLKMFSRGGSVWGAEFTETTLNQQGYRQSEKNVTCSMTTDNRIESKSKNEDPIGPYVLDFVCDERGAQ